MHLVFKGALQMSRFTFTLVYNAHNASVDSRKRTPILKRNSQRRGEFPWLCWLI